MTGERLRADMIAVATRCEPAERDEDRFAVHRLEDRLVVVLGDGAGGMGGGAAAADAVCGGIAERATRACGDPLVWRDALHELDSALSIATHGGQTTAVVVELFGHMVCGASVGDSGVWLVSTEGILDLTAAQSRKPLVGSG